MFELAVLASTGDDTPIEDLAQLADKIGRGFRSAAYLQCISTSTVIQNTTVENRNCQPH